LHRHGAQAGRSLLFRRLAHYEPPDFSRVKLGEALKKRGLAPHIFESAAQAREDRREETR
jgi:hypothetical protein